MKARVVQRIPFPTDMPLLDLVNFALANDITIEISNGKAFYKVYEIEYDPELMVVGDEE